MNDPLIADYSVIPESLENRAFYILCCINVAVKQNLKGDKNMNGKITIDGYYKGEGKYELIHHGGKPDPEALCSLTYSYYHNIEVVGLLSMMKDSIQRYIDADNDRISAELQKGKINTRLAKEGLPALTQQQLDTVFDELSSSEDEKEVLADG